MKRLRERDQIANVAQRWHGQYGTGTYSADKRGRDVYAELTALDPATATAEQVADIVGGNSWVAAESCHECRAESWDIVEVGEPADYESATARLCADCLRKALALLEAPPETGGGFLGKVE